MKDFIDYLTRRQGQHWFTASHIHRSYGGDISDIRSWLMLLTVGPEPVLKGYTIAEFGTNLADPENLFVIFCLVAK